MHHHNHNHNHTNPSSSRADQNQSNVAKNPSHLSGRRPPPYTPGSVAAGIAGGRSRYLGGISQTYTAGTVPTEAAVAQAAGSIAAGLIGRNSRYIPGRIPGTSALFAADLFGGGAGITEKKSKYIAGVAGTSAALYAANTPNLFATPSTGTSKSKSKTNKSKYVHGHGTAGTSKSYYYYTADSTTRFSGKKPSRNGKIAGPSAASSSSSENSDTDIRPRSRPKASRHTAGASSLLATTATGSISAGFLGRKSRYIATVAGASVPQTSRSVTAGILTPRRSKYMSGIARTSLPVPEAVVDSGITPAMAKAALRRKVKDLVLKMTPNKRRKQSSVIVQKVLESEAYITADRICLYLSLDEEVSTDDILIDALYSGKTVFIPRYTESHMDMLKLSSLDDYDNLPKTKWNIKQPANPTGRDEALASGGLDLMLVPGLAFTKDGHRLGRGKGYYDAYLHRCRVSNPRPLTTIGLAFKEQIVDSIPTQPHDIQLDQVIYCEEILKPLPPPIEKPEKSQKDKTEKGKRKAWMP